MASRWPIARARVRFTLLSRVASLGAIAALAATVAMGRWTMPYGLSLALLLVVAAAALRRGVDLDARAVSAEGDALRFEGGAGERALARAQIEAGWVVPEATSARVEFRLRNGELVVADAADAEVANEVLEAAGFDAQRRALRVTLGRSWDGLARAIAALVFGGLQTFPLLLLFSAWLGMPPALRGVFFAVVAITGFVSASRFLGPAEILIGADGLSVRRGFRPRFLPYRLLRWVEADGEDIVLLLEDNQRVRISATDRDASRAAMVVERIRRAAARARGEGGSAALALLDRNGRSVEAWREGVRALVQNPAGYRGAAPGVDELERVLADPGASAERRIAAAMGLAAQGDDGARTRVRVVAEACASEAMRAAFEATLRGDLDEAAVARATDDDGDVAEMRRGLGV